MPERALIPIVAGVALGFVAGIIAAVGRLDRATVLELVIVVGLAAGAAGIASVAGVRGDRDEKGLVALLRGGLAAMIAALVVFALVSFLGEGDVAVGVALLLVAGLAALPLARLLVHERLE